MSRRRYPWESDEEKLVLDTPEQTKVEYRIAPFGTRIMAAILDRLIIAGIIIGICVPLAILGTFGGGYLLAVALVCWFLVSMFYFVWSEIAGEGRTFGKRRFGLRTVAATGHGLTPGGSLVRNLARIVDELPVAWIVPVLAPGRQRIGDFLAGTFVISEVLDAPVHTNWIDGLARSYRDLEERRFPVGAAVAEKLDPEDLNLLEYLDSSLSRLRARERRVLLGKIATKYVDRLELSADRERILADPERFLQELALFLRSRFERHLTP